jgi:hypothetical protein
VALSGIVYVLTWRHALETSQDPNYLRPGQRMVIYAKFLDKLDAILLSGDTGPDPEQCRWPAYNAIFRQASTSPDDRRPILLSEDDPRLSQRSISAGQAMEWMEDSKLMAIANYRQVLEDGPDICDDEPLAEYSDHGDELEGMYTSGTHVLRRRRQTPSARSPGNSRFRNLNNVIRRQLPRTTTI